jgi:hypothetical protein
MENYIIHPIHHSYLYYTHTALQKIPKYLDSKTTATDSVIQNFEANYSNLLANLLIFGVK